MEFMQQRRLLQNKPPLPWRQPTRAPRVRAAHLHAQAHAQAEDEAADDQQPGGGGDGHDEGADHEADAAAHHGGAAPVAVVGEGADHGAHDARQEQAGHKHGERDVIVLAEGVRAGRGQLRAGWRQGCVQRG